ncbi:MAG: hypothetical protein U0736_00095 [Gemmataceae bacterium]
MLCLLLCLVVLTAATTGSLRHAHDDGDTPHGHALGLAGLFAGTAPTRLPGGSGQPHRHLLFLGFEVYEGDGAPLPTADDPDFQLAAGVESAPTVSASPPTVDRTLPAPSSPAASLLRPAEPATSPPPLAPPALPVCATRARSGVLSV